MREQRDGWAGFFGTVALTAVLLGGGLALLSGYLIGHFSHPKEKTTTIARSGLPGLPIAGAPAPAAPSPSSAPSATTPAPAATTTTETQKPETQTATTPAEPAAGKTPSGAGKTVFAANCASCHTLKAANASGQVGPNLDQTKFDEKAIATQVQNGGGAMPAFGKNKILTAAQIQEVAQYVAQVAGK
jgi:mono/diheme cytochrome c family protein